eukprot:202110_1
MALEDDYSSVVSIIYFSVNIIFLLGLGVVVYNQGGHDIKSKSYFKDIWNQRKIYAPLIIHFYDTATDIGVIYSWYGLMRDETDYISVDMAVFFGTGVAFLAVYRLCLLVFSLYDWLCGGDGKWYHVLLVLVDLYIFVAVYDSFTKAGDIISENAEKRQKKRKERAEKSTEQPQGASADKEKEIEPASRQYAAQLGEAITESMPQIVLQSVFVIRSANDGELRAASNMYLIMLSVIASLLSISNKYVTLDKTAVCLSAQSLKPRERFPGCVQYWYLVRVIWRVFHVMSRFCVFVLIWTILGGAWLPIWTGCTVVYWMTIYCTLKGRDDTAGILAVGIISCIGMYFEGDFDAYKESLILISLVSIQSVIGIGLITIFGVFSFRCGICSDPGTRQIFDNTNRRVLLFWTLGIVSSAMDIILFLVMRNQNIFYPLYRFLKTELCTMIGDDTSMDDLDAFLRVDCPSYVSPTNRTNIFESIASKENNGSFTRQEYSNWIQSLTHETLYADTGILHGTKY